VRARVWERDGERLGVIADGNLAAEREKRERDGAGSLFAPLSSAEATLEAGCLNGIDFGSRS